MTVIGLRRATPADREYCYRLHKAAMGDYVTAVRGWDEEDQRGFHDRVFDPDRWRIVVADGSCPAASSAAARSSTAKSTDVNRTERARADGSQAAVLCGDRAVDRRPSAYWTRIQRARATEPVLGPLLDDISPCAFWPTAPRERPTAVRNAVPALIVNSTGDTRTGYPGALALHRDLTASRLVTLRGARIHAVCPRYGDACVNGTVNAYFAFGHLPAADLTCRPRD